MWMRNWMKAGGGDFYDDGDDARDFENSVR